MSLFLESLINGFNGTIQQRHLLEAALKTELPTPRDEAWKYTSLRNLERRKFIASPLQHAFSNEHIAVLKFIPAPRLVFINGRPITALSEVSHLPSGMRVRPLSTARIESADELGFLKRRFNEKQEVFAQLNAALADEGVIVQLDEVVQMEKTLHLVFISTSENNEDYSWHHRHLIELRRNASLNIQEYHLHYGKSEHFSNTLSHIHLSKGAKLKHVRIQYDSPQATSILRSDAVVAPHADYQRLDMELGAGLSRHELNVRLEGQHSGLTSYGILLGDQRRHLDTHLAIDHIAGHTKSNILWRGIAMERSRAVFHGGIRIRSGADGSQAELSNKNLLLADTAEINTQPVLIIEADEVKASHGATVGQLDAQALFYLRSRGIDKNQAEKILSRAFCYEPLTLLGGEDANPLVPYLNQALQQTNHL